MFSMDKETESSASYIGWENDSYSDSSDSNDYKHWAVGFDFYGAENSCCDTNKLEEHYNKKSNDALFKCFINIKKFSFEKQKAIKTVYEKRAPKNLPGKLYDYLIENDLMVINNIIEKFSIKMHWKTGGILLLRYKNIHFNWIPITRIIVNIIKTRYHDANFFKNFDKHEIVEFSEQDQINIMWSFYIKNQTNEINKILQENGHLLFQIIAVNNITMKGKINATVNKSSNILISSLNINFAYNAFIHCKNQCGRKILVEQRSTMSKIPMCIECTQEFIVINCENCCTGKVIIKQGSHKPNFPRCIKCTQKEEIKKIKSQPCCIQ